MAASLQSELALCAWAMLGVISLVGIAFNVMRARFGWEAR